MDTVNPVTQLSTADTLKFLSEQPLGRLAISINDSPDIFPVNYVIHARSDDDVVAYIRASAGNKLFATAVGSPLALETDLVETDTATSAILYGTARQVQYPDELQLVESTGLTAWIAEHKPDVIAIDVERISGRTFKLGPPPEYPISETPD